MLDEARITEIKGMLAAARQREINFGLCLGSKAEDTSLVMHRNKAPEALGKAAKAEAGTARMACGTLTVEGKNVKLTCQSEPPTGIAKRAKSFLKLMKLNMRVSVLGEGGIVYEEDGDEEDGETQSEDAGEDPAAGDWKVLHEKLELKVRSFITADSGDVGRVRAAWAMANEAAGQGDFPGALRIGNRIEGMLVPAGGGDPGRDDSPEDAPSPAHAKWLLASGQIAPHVEAMLKKGTGQPDKIRAVWAFAQGKAEAKDYAAAVKSLGPLAQLITEARDSTTTPVGEATKDVDVDRTRVELLAANWASESGKLGPRVADVLKTQPAERSRIEAVWGFATERAERAAKDGSEADYATALKALVELKKLLDTAAPESLAPVGGVGIAKDALTADQKLKSAQTLLAATTKTAEAALKRVREEFKPALPTALDLQAKKLDGLVAPSTETDADKIELAAKTLGEEVVKLDDLAVGPRADRTAWAQDLSVFEVRLLTLENHPLNAEVTVVKPLLDGIRNDLAQAKLKATAMEWAEGSKALKLLLPRCDAAEVAADGLAQFNAIRADRVGRLAPLPAAGGIAQAQPKNAVLAARKLLADADIEKTAKRFAPGVALLDQIPDAVDHATNLISQAADYDGRYPDYEDYVTELEGFGGVAEVAIATGLADFRGKVVGAEITTTNDYTASMTALNNCFSQYLSLKALAEQATNYTDALQAYETRFTEVKDHPGRIAVEEFFERMKTDKTYAEARILKFEYEIAAKTLKATVPLHAAQIALADICKDYKEKHKKAGDDIVELNKLANAGKAAQGIAEAQRLITAAESAATGKDWPGALKAIEQAAAAVAAATALIGADKALGDLKDGAKLDAIATDFASAIGVYEAMRSNVAGKDTTGAFTARLGTAAAPAQRARDEAGKTPTPDFVKARAELDTAIGICEATLLLAMKKTPFDTALAGLKSAHTNLALPATNVDDCIAEKVEEVARSIANAELMAKAEIFNFDGAQRAIGTGLLAVRQAERDAAAYKAMKPDLEKIKTTLTFLKDPARVAGLAAEIRRLEDAETSIKNDVLASKLPDAAKTAAAAAKLCPGFEQLGKDYVRAFNLRKKVNDAMPDIEGAGKEAAASELAAAKAKMDQVQLLFDDHIYAGVQRLASEAWWIKEAGKAIVAAVLLYEPKRLLAETALSTTLPNRNPATEVRYDAQRETYDAALEIAKQRNFARAETMVTPIPAALGLLAADSQAYRDYETARKNAGIKLGEAMKSKQAAAIRPLLAHLKSRHDAAVKLADSEDWAGAKKLLDLILIEAGAAVVAANEFDTFATMAEDLKKKPGEGTIGLAASIEAAKKLLADLLAKPESMYVVASLTEAGKTIKQAEDLAKTDEGQARPILLKAVDACGAARIGIGHYVQMEAEITALTGDINTFLSTHAQAVFVKDAAEKLLLDIEASRGEARASGGYEAATKLLETADTAFLALRRAADAEIVYVARKGVVEANLAKMEKHPNRYAIKKEIDSFRKDVSDADGLAAKHDHKAAMALLDSAADTAAGALLKAKMHANESPSLSDVKKILDGADGSKKLDAIIETLDPQAKRKVLGVAFEARFGCKLNVYKSKGDEDTLRKWKEDNPNADQFQVISKERQHKDINLDKKAPNIRRFYDLMCELPDTHTKDNDSMQVFTEVSGDAEGSDFSGGRREVTMREGAASSSGAYGVGLTHEIEDVLPGCETIPGEDTSYYDWNTLHEVGHAVDDKLGFMKSRGNALAGWTEHGGDVRPIAQAVAGEFTFDVAYVASYIAGTAEPPIPEPNGCNAEEWERRRVACRAWVDRARSTNDPWQTTSSAKQTAIGDTCYQESYPGTWTSYPLEERKKGVSGYQFRAPGEWFSELYAAYHTGKLKPSHPAVAWLENL